MLLRSETAVKILSHCLTFVLFSSSLAISTFVVASPEAIAKTGATYKSHLHGKKVTRKKPTAAEVAVYQRIGEKLRSQGVNTRFIQKLIHAAKPEDREPLVRANVFNFHQSTQPDYSGHFSDEAVLKCESLISRHKKAFSLAERTYEVPASTIASLMWVETRHGKMTGRYAIANAYMNLASANDKALIDKLIGEFKEKGAVKEAEVEAFRQKSWAAAERKSKWAIEQLLALAVMNDRKVDVFSIKGSSAGAFGIPQFIPTSYLKWAKSGSPRTLRPPNLYRWDDAIMSVAFYLNNHGWSAIDDNQMNALLAYNRSRDYAQIILKISKAVDSNEQLAQRNRSVAGESRD